MKYHEAVETAVFQRVDASRETIGTTPVMLANLADKILPDNLEVRAGDFLFLNERLDSMADLVSALNLPGVRFLEPLYTVTPGTFPTKEFPKKLTNAFEVSDLVPRFIDADTDDFLKAIKTLWGKVQGLGFYTPSQLQKINLCIDNGFAPVPVVADVYGRYYGSQPLAMRSPLLSNDARAQQWTLVCTSFATAVKEAVGKKYKQAAAIARESAANTAFWEKVYATVEAIRDAPFTVASGVGSAFWDGIGPKWKMVLIGGALVGVAYFTFPFWRAAVKGKTGV